MTGADEGARSRGPLDTPTPEGHATTDSSKQGVPARFELGNLVMTKAIDEWVKKEPALHLGLLLGFVKRHVSGDWGNVDKEDWKVNDHAVARGARIVSSYEINGFPKIWIITEWDRSVTTILFPDDY